jgi:Lipopolysaccharide-assembly
MRTYGFLLAALLALGGSGCAGYRVGPVNGLVAGEKSVQFNPFTDQTLEPRVVDSVNLELRQQLQRDGTFHLATHDDGDIVVSGALVDFHREEIGFAASDVLTVTDYRLHLVAQVTAQDRSTGKLIFHQSVAGQTIIRVTNDLTSAERQAMPLLAEDLAKNIVALLSEGSW